MMQKLLSFSLLFMSLFTLSIAARDVLLEIKGSGFFPTSHVFKKIYHNTGMVGAELTVNICDCWYGWASVDGLRKTGFSIGGGDKTKVSYVPLGFGLKYFYSRNCVDWYLGLGILAGHIHTHDYSPYVVPTYSKWGCGGIAKVGCIIDMCESIFLDIFFNYSFIKARSHDTDGGLVYPHSAKIDAALLGIGLGYRF